MSKIQYSEKPYWTPLELMVGPDRCREFMFMGCVEEQGTLIYLYKNIISRNYINIDSDGYTWQFRLGNSHPPHGVYIPCPKEEAVQWVLR